MDQHRTSSQHQYESGRGQREDESRRPERHGRYEQERGGEWDTQAQWSDERTRYQQGGRDEWSRNEPSGWSREGVGPARGLVSSSQGHGDRSREREMYGGRSSMASTGAYGWGGMQGSESMHRSGSTMQGERSSTSAQNYVGRGPKGYKRSDDRIREEVSDRLMDDRSVDASEVEVQVKDGEVTLTGSVSDREQKRRAEECAEEISGVTDVINNLRVMKADGRPNGQQTSSDAGGQGSDRQKDKMSSQGGGAPGDIAGSDKSAKNRM